ncbi:hypothetical protein C7974DRAFT_397240 [Boeremia exigua]|uniref:uncharacterized protein n=1 Tax=Boeremia exigua TaxID=749465 RepID=UPI001E8E7CEA|nr:uncharacterized protein C7974DRAFT_397240 [Boeremia exigua]KAH6621847.1 hypothetical protein C7974DRAFT_397240 [Boeremia exigua]
MFPRIHAVNPAWVCACFFANTLRAQCWAVATVAAETRALLSSRHAAVDSRAAISASMTPMKPGASQSCAVKKALVIRGAGVHLRITARSCAGAPSSGILRARIRSPCPVLVCSSGATSG